MIRAIVKNGMIQPLEPLPPEWSEGREMLVQEANGSVGSTSDQLDEWYRDLETLCAAADPVDDDRLSVALAQAHEEAKALMRRQMEANGRLT